MDRTTCSHAHMGSFNQRPVVGQSLHRRCTLGVLDASHDGRRRGPCPHASGSARGQNVGFCA